MSASRLLHLLTCVLACAWFAGCADLGVMHEEEPTGAATGAEQLYQQGDFDQAAQAFLQLADAHSGARAHYRLRAAEAYHENGEIDAVAQTLEGIKPKRLGTEEVVRYNLLEAELALNRHDPARANEFLDFADATLSMPLRLRALELRARAKADGGDALASARTRAELDRWLGGADRQQNEAQLIATLQPLGPDALKQQATSLLPGDPLRPWLDMAFGLRRNGQALPLVVMRPNQAVGTIQQGEREGFRAAHRIALLLPDSGPLKAVAQPVRDGFFAAHFADADPQRAEIMVYDSGSSAADTVAAYQKAAATGVDHIVGPLSRDAVSAVFAQGHLPVALLALNQPERGETPPPGSAAFGLTPDAEAAQAAEHMRERGISRAVIITATEDWAERAALAFRAQFESRNAQIVGEARVQDGEVNFSTMIHQALVGVTVTTVAPGTPPVQVSPPSDTGIFISMRPQQARLLLPQLKLAGYSNVPVFATSHIYTGNNNPGMDRDLDGVEFCDAPWLFDATLALPKRSEIVRSLDSARGAGGRLFALGMDAYALLPYMDWLAQRPDSFVSGATGQLAEDSLGRIQRLLTWVRFDNGTPHLVNGGLQMSAALPQ